MIVFSWFRRNSEDENAEAAVSPTNTEPALPSPSPPALSAEPYTDSEEHLWDHLLRIDQLVRAQTIRWRLTIGTAKLEQWWGMVHVTEAEVNAYLQAPYRPPHHLPANLAARLAAYREASQRLADAIQEREERTPAGMNLRVTRLTELFDLSPLDRDILLCCLLPQLDGRYRRLFGYLQDDASRTQPTVELLLETLQTETPAMGRAAFGQAAPLLRHRLLVLNGSANDHPARAAQALAMRSVCVDERITGYLLGSDAPAGRLADLVREPAPAGWDQLIMNRSRLQRLQRLASWWRERRQLEQALTLFFHGPYGSDRLTTARAICTTVNQPLLVMDIAAGLRADLGWKELVALAYREAALRDAALYWAGCEALLDGDQPNGRWERLIAEAERFKGLTILASQTAWDPAGRFRERPFLRLEFPMPDYETRRRLWEAHLPPPEAFVRPAPDRATLAELLANGFQLTKGQILDTLVTARGQATRRDPEQPRLTTEDLYEGCRRQSGRRLMTMARRIEPRTELTFQDLILPAPNQQQLQELRSRIRYQHHVYSGLGFERRLSLGKGLIALFTGSSGTGKTMAAELLAREQGVDLYKVDLSAVVSKYVGETEKNLSQVFSEAEDANAIIFFDEADALFGQRGEVKAAQDRWANMEINYLLQRIEEYAGVVILASNLRQNIDDAFMRRIHVIVEFPFPDAEARYHIWRGMFPTDVERPPDAEIRDLAERFRLSGGSIKNVVVDSAFRALAEASQDPIEITLRHLMIAVAREYQKLGKPLTKSEFGERYYAWITEAIL
jgi:SpoVK/Ycf46/Vps4 family AAA+-type ATPase